MSANSRQNFPEKREQLAIEFNEIATGLPENIADSFLGLQLNVHAHVITPSGRWEGARGLLEAAGNASLRHSGRSSTVEG